jgi:DNA-binding CsgD family transcriptional regulator
MVPIVIAGAFVVAVAVWFACAAARLFRRRQSPALLSYLFYLIFWHILILYMLVYLAAPLVLPEGAQHGYALFNSIFVIPLHGLIAWFFADFIWKWSGGRNPRLLKLGLPLPFLAVLVFYTAQVIKRLSEEKASEPFVLSAPVSLLLMFGVILGVLIHTVVRNRRKKEVVRFAAVMSAGLIVGFLFIFCTPDDLGGHWQNALTSLVFTAMNIPAWFILRRTFREQAPAPVTDLSQLKERYGISPREQEVIALVIAGKKNREIEEALFISPDTVKKHIYNVYRKMGVNSRVQLVNAVLELSCRQD